MGEDLNVTHYHEALVRACTITVMIDALLEEHPAIAAHEDLVKALDKLQKAGGYLYQAIGRHMHKIEEGEDV